MWEVHLNSISESSTTKHAANFL